MGAFAPISLQIVCVLHRLFIRILWPACITAKGISIDLFLILHSFTSKDSVCKLRKICYTHFEVMAMFDITLICMGKLKEKFYIGAAQEYEKRLCAYCRFRLLELPEFKLPEDPSPAQIDAGLDKEAEQILSKIPKGAWLCIWTPEGKMLSSEELAVQMKDVKLSGKSSACFLIGSSFGISQKIKQLADFKLSMSKMTFPHHLARIMVLEQLYRAEAIQAGSKYHK